MKTIKAHNHGAHSAPQALFIDLADIKPKQVREMYEIYECYYENTAYEIFANDLGNKSGAIMLFHPVTNKVVGFSTMVLHQFEFGRKNYTFLFSGDTVVMREFWGNRALQATFVKLVMKLRFRYPFDELYWLLISKGYKTYLLMANNYYVYYPHFEGKYKSLEPVLRHYLNTFFADYYDQKTGLLNFGEDYQALKGEVAPITDEMRKNSPKIHFFEEKNPTWQQGTELPCIGYLG